MFYFFSIGGLHSWQKKASEPAKRRWLPSRRGLCKPHFIQDMVSPTLPMPIKGEPFSRLVKRSPLSLTSFFPFFVAICAFVSVANYIAY